MKYLVGVDSSKNAEKAFETAISYMNKEEDEIFVISVAEDSGAIVMGPYADVSFLVSLDKKIEEQTRNLLKVYARKCKAHNVKYTCLLAKGSPKDAICNEVVTRDIDVLVMGRRGAGWMERLVIGSNSEHCLHNAKCSVLVVKEDPEDAA